MSEWQPIETVPWDTAVLISGKDWNGDRFVCSAFVYKTAWSNNEPIITCHMFSGYELERDFSTERVTHWMPLPNPPADEEK